MFFSFPSSSQILLTYLPTQLHILFLFLPVSKNKIIRSRNPTKMKIKTIKRLIRQKIPRQNVMKQKVYKDPIEFVLCWLTTPVLRAYPKV